MQLFALPAAPPGQVTVHGRTFRLERVFKHDFFAATTLYAAQRAGAGPRQVVVKFGRTQGFCGLSGRWIGRWLLRREQRFHRRADGIAGIQRWLGGLSDTAYVLEYVPGQTLDALATPPSGAFFDALRETLDALHRRDVACCDLNKRSNIVVGPGGRPVLIDFQISMVHDPALPWRWLTWPLVRYFQRMDLYHLYKHKRRLAPAELRPQEAALLRRPGRLLSWHRRLVTPLRGLRRAFLARLHRAGRLISPSAHLEDHQQPEKATWRR